MIEFNGYLSGSAEKTIFQADNKVCASTIFAWYTICDTGFASLGQNDVPKSFSPAVSVCFWWRFRSLLDGNVVNSYFSEQNDKKKSYTQKNRF